MRVTLGLLLVVSVAGLAGLAYSELNFRQRAQELDADLAAYRRLRWERPILRGKAQPGNAVEAALAAVAALEPAPRPLLEALTEDLFYGQLLQPTHARAIAERRAGLQALREATARSWSMSYLQPELGRDMPIPDYQRVIEATLLLLAHGTSLDSDECLAVCADAIRIGQDLVPGAPLQAASAAMRIASLASPVVRTCAKDASLAGLRRAAGEFRSLASHPAPTGHGLILRDLIEASELRTQGTLGATAGHGRIIATLSRRGDWMDAWAYFRDPHRFRAVTPEGYPGSLEAWRREERWRSESSLPTVLASTEGVHGYLKDDMRGQALVRALTVGLSILVERKRLGRTPDQPSALRESALKDPFSGHPLLFRMPEGGGEFSVWSVGEDMRNGEAEETWSERAPLDVVAHLRLPDDRAAGQRSRRNR